MSLLNTCSNLEEADTLLMFNALLVFQITDKITIMTSDTDLFNSCSAIIYIVDTSRLPLIRHRKQERNKSAPEKHQRIALISCAESTLPGDGVTKGRFCLSSNGSKRMRMRCKQVDGWHYLHLSSHLLPPDSLISRICAMSI